MKTVLTIAGSDSIGGAGIEADIKTITMHNTYAMAAVTALTAQNTTGVQEILNVPAEFLEKELNSIFTDITPDAIKIGMVSCGESIEVVSKKLRFYKAKNIVVDPVMVSTSGCKLFDIEQIDVLEKELFSIATVITPNLFESEILSGREISSLEDLILVAKELATKYDCNVLCKGGHLVNSSDDVLCLKNTSECTVLKSSKINNSNTHGTGCTLSSAIASNLALGKSLLESIKNAKSYVHSAIASMLKLGKGTGPINHMACLDFFK